MSSYKLNFTGEQINSFISKFFDSLNTVFVSASTGSDIKMIKDTTVLTAKEENGKWVFHPNEFGIWSVVASNNNLTAEDSININSIKIYEVNISYT